MRSSPRRRPPWPHPGRRPARTRRGTWRPGRRRSRTTRDPADRWRSPARKGGHDRREPDRGWRRRAPQPSPRRPYATPCCHPAGPQTTPAPSDALGTMSSSGPGPSIRPRSPTRTARPSRRPLARWFSWRDRTITSWPDNVVVCRTNSSRRAPSRRFRLGERLRRVGAKALNSDRTQSTSSGPSLQSLLVREHVAAVLDEERVVVALVRILRVVLRARWRSIREVLLGVDRAHRTDVGLIARRARRALLEVHVQDAVTEDTDRVGIGGVRGFDDPAAGFLLGEQHVLLGIELIDALHGADIHARSILHVDARFSDDRETGHKSAPHVCC